LADDSVRLLHSKYISDKTWSEVEAVRKQIIDGTVKVEPTFDAVKVRSLMTSVSAPPK
jgi:basic membrane protein A and related proteins